MVFYMVFCFRVWLNGNKENVESGIFLCRMLQEKSGLCIFVT